MPRSSITNPRLIVEQIEQYMKQSDRLWLLAIHGDRHATIPLASIPVEMAIADLYHRL